MAARLALVPAPLRRALRNLSIKRKLTAIVTVTSGLAVVLASALFLAFDYRSFKQQMVVGLEATARNIGEFAAPALDPQLQGTAAAAQADAALKQFLDSLRAYESIQEALVYDATGQLRGVKRSLARQDDPPPPFSPRNGHEFGKDGLVLYERILSQDGDFVGVARLRSNTDSLTARFQRYLGILGAVTAALVVAVAVRL